MFRKRFHPVRHQSSTGGVALFIPPVNRNVMERSGVAVWGRAPVVQNNGTNGWGAVLNTGVV